ncbi:hypothetical protein [Pleomorphomonas koreensis]|uniref:hypothetical protein n=1 Tax=Pleomorphomonas koreensis TaxID=257440 RepID=UPI0012EB345F|nr:hypothetical protein [Pleomorphomonas koreensis]
MTSWKFTRIGPGLPQGTPNRPPAEAAGSGHPRFYHVVDERPVNPDREIRPPAGTRDHNYVSIRIVDFPQRRPARLRRLLRFAALSGQPEDLRGNSRRISTEREKSGKTPDR